MHSISENGLKNEACTTTEVRDKNMPGHPNENLIDLMSENNRRFIQKSETLLQDDKPTKQVVFNINSGTYGGENLIESRP